MAQGGAAEHTGGVSRDRPAAIGGGVRDLEEQTILITGATSGLGRALAERAPAGTLDVVVSGDMVSRGKPDPEAYLTAASELGVAPGECVALEDSPAGVGAAVAASAALTAHALAGGERVDRKSVV